MADVRQNGFPQVFSDFFDGTVAKLKKIVVYLQIVGRRNGVKNVLIIKT